MHRAGRARARRGSWLGDRGRVTAARLAERAARPRPPSPRNALAPAPASRSFRLGGSRTRVRGDRRARRSARRPLRGWAFGSALDTLRRKLSAMRRPEFLPRASVILSEAKDLASAASFPVRFATRRDPLSW